MSNTKTYGGASNMNILLQHENPPPPSSSEVFESLWIPTSSPTFHGSKSMVNMEDNHGDDTNERSSYFQLIGKEENGDEDFDGCFQQPGKKRRLTSDQVLFLEKNFDVENKLEPERKVQLAKEIGLQPRQVAIWFQNRRARFKTKQLEKDYNSLKGSFDGLRADYDCLLKEKENLKTQVLNLKERLLLQDKEKENTEPSDHTNEDSRSEQPHKTISNSVSKNVDSAPTIVACKQEDASSAKSDVIDSDSPHYTSLLEPADSSHVFESDFSQDEEDNLSKNLLPTMYFPKLEEDECYNDPSASSCNFGFSTEDQPFWLLPY